MANEHLIDLADLSDQQLLELAASRPKVYRALVEADPRVQLHERIYNADGSLKVDGKDMTFREIVEEMGVRIAPDSNLARARRHAKAEIADDVVAIKKLRKELEDEKQGQRYQAFRDTLRARAQDLGFTPKDEELDKIEAFMKDNEYGEKSATVAVEKYYETAEPAVPNFEQDFTFGSDSSTAADAEYRKKLLEAPLGSDTSQLTLAHAERVWQEMFGPDKSGKRKNR